MIDPITAIQLGSTAIGFLGSLFGGDESKTGRMESTTSRRSPELTQALQELMKMYQEGIDVSGLKRSARERAGYETSGLRQAAISRLRRANVPPSVIEQVLSGVTVGQNRVLDEALSKLDVYGQEFKLKPLSLFGELASGMESTTQSTQYGPGGQAFSQLLGGGLYGLMNNPNFNDLFKKGYSQNQNPTGGSWRAP